jgi:hypothetical protein
VNLNKISNVVPGMIMLIFAVFAVGCGGNKVETKPPVVTPQPPREPTIDELRKPVFKDPDMFKASQVIKEYGQLKKKSITFEKYAQLTGGQSGAAINPDWFYDTYLFNANENGYWATVTFGTAKRAKEKDPRIAQVFGDLPESSITVSLITPSKKTYILLDYNADGILDFVKESNAKTVLKVDVALLDAMQEKYTWLLGVIKKGFKKPGK